MDGVKVCNTGMSGVCLVVRVRTYRVWQPWHLATCCNCWLGAMSLAWRADTAVLRYILDKALAVDTVP